MTKRVLLIIALHMLCYSVFAESAREYFKFAKFNFDKQEYVQALNYINKAIDVDPLYVNGLLLRAEINFGLQKFNEVIEDITLAFNMDDNVKISMAEFYLLRGDAYFKLRNLQKSLTDINTSIELNPKNARAHF